MNGWCSSDLLEVIVTQLWELGSQSLDQEAGPLFLPIYTQGLSFPHDLPNRKVYKILTCLDSPILSYIPISSPNKEISFLKSETMLSTSHILSKAQETSQNLEVSSNAY